TRAALSRSPRGRPPGAAGRGRGFGPGRAAQRSRCGRRRGAGDGADPLAEWRRPSALRRPGSARGRAVDRLIRTLVADPAVTDVLINGDGSVWIDRGEVLEAAAHRLSDPGAVRRLAVRLAALARRRLDDAMPYADGQLPDGIRLHAVLAPIATDGAHI